MSQFHRSLFDVVPSLGVTRHHMLSRHRHPHLARHREMFGSGHEPYLGWECFMELFLETHGLLSEETVHSLDRELSENLTDLPNVPPSARLGHRLRINGISEFEVEFQEFILTRHRRRGEGEDPDCIAQMPHGPINFRHMSLNRLLRLFRELRRARRTDKWNTLAQAFLARCDGWFYPRFIRNEDPLDLSGLGVPEETKWTTIVEPTHDVPLTSWDEWREQGRSAEACDLQDLASDGSSFAPSRKRKAPGDVSPESVQRP